MRYRLLLLALLAFCLPAYAQTVDIGSGSPTEGIRQSFIRAYFRNGFNNLVSSPPLGDVKKLGTQGLVQEFADASKNQANKYALIKPNASAPSVQYDADMVQMYPALYTYYTSLGPTNVGYPTTDTLNCPTLVNTPNNSCQYQLFDKPYALFVFKNQVQGAGVNFGTANPYYTKWQAIGGIAAAGPATSAPQTITAASGIAASFQTFDNGAIFNITSGTLAGRLVAVGPGVYASYAAAGGYSGFLGLPLTDEQILPAGHHRQSFEGGSIEYDPAGGVPIVRLPVYSISVTPSAQSIKLNLGDSITLSAMPSDASGNDLLDRTIVWSTSNNRVLQIQPSGLTVTVKAIGGGTATVTASSEAKTSPPLTVIVTSTCCGIGEGAPTPAIQQAFQDAITRDRLTPLLPAALPVRRVANGYVQDLQDAAGALYELALPDRSAVAYVLSGPILAKYMTLGGLSSALGYPSSDATAAGRQLFINQSALAGNPVQLVTGSLLTKWAALGYETGIAGPPTSPAMAVLSFGATPGSVQTFTNGTLAGPNGKVFFITGSIAAAWLQAGGAAGSLGFPTADQYSSGTVLHQDFEGGYVEGTIGSPAAQIHLAPRTPLITATPSAVLAGTRLRLAVAGFDPGATIRVSLTGQPDFTIKSDSGAYVWETVVPSNSKSGTVSIHAVDSGTGSYADASYTVRTLAEVHLQLVKASGDAQSGLPGAALLRSLDLQVRDDTGNPVEGIPVQFSASPGAQILTATPVTDSSGAAHATVRLPASEGIALVTAQAGRDTVTFTAQVQQGSLQNFPKITSSPDPLLSSAAAVLRFYQDRGDLPSPNGFSDPAALGQFLKGVCSPSPKGGQLCDGFLTGSGGTQVVNLWRLASFVGGNLDVSIEQPDLAHIRDLVGQGFPVVVQPTGQETFSVATGIAPDGSLLTAPASSKITSISAAVRLVPRPASARGFLVAGTPGLQVYSPLAICPSISFSNLAQAFCDGTQDGYELQAPNTPFHIAVTDFGNATNQVALDGNGPSSFYISRVGTQWTASPQTTAFTAAGVVNAASFTPEIATGGLFTMFGTGLARLDSPTSVQIGGVAAAIVAQSPFQVSAAVPSDLAPGTYPISVTSPYGTATQSITVLAVAPAIFVAVNQDGALNTPDNPARRGSTLVVYCTGLGATVQRGALSFTTETVTALIAGTALKPAFAGLTPGFTGLYQVNIPIPLSLPPGLGLMLSLQEGDRTSSPLDIAIQ